MSYLKGLSILGIWFFTRVDKLYKHADRLSGNCNYGGLGEEKQNIYGAEILIALHSKHLSITILSMLFAISILIIIFYITLLIMRKMSNTWYNFRLDFLGFFYIWRILSLNVLIKLLSKKRVYQPMSFQNLRVLCFPDARSLDY